MTETPRKFGFIVHCRNTRELRLALARYRLAPHLSFLPERRLKDYCLKQGFIENVCTFTDIVSDRHVRCQGKALCLLLTTEQLLEHQSYATELVVRAARRAEAWGARMIGLGAICAVIGARGAEVAASCAAAVTTGNSLTAYTSLVTYDNVLRRLAVAPRSQTVVIIGFPGSITLVIAKVLHARGIPLVLVSRRQTAFLEKFISSLGGGTGTVAVTQDIPSALAQGRVIFSATSTGQLIDQDQLLPGSIVFDIAQPKDVIQKKVPRRDVLIIDAGLISLPRATQRVYRYSGCYQNDIPSCLGETITLTFDERWENFSIGRELDLDRMREIGRLAEEHGFVFDQFRSFGRPIPQHILDATRDALHQTTPQMKGTCHETAR
jgi:putrescine aminotransferase